MRFTATRKITRTFVATILLLGLTSIAQADFIPATWSEGINFRPNIRITPDRSHTYDHDLRTDGFQPLSDILLFYSLNINLFDDRQDPGGRRGREIALVDLPGVFGDRVFFNLNGPEFGGFSLAGWLQLNILGTLTVTVESLRGDFILGNSRLRGFGLAHVPEPGTLALLGLGLVGMGMTRRRKKV